MEPFFVKKYRDFEASSLGILVFRETSRLIWPDFDPVFDQFWPVLTYFAGQTWPILTYSDPFAGRTWPIFTYFDLNHFVLLEVCSVDILVTGLRITADFEGYSFRGTHLWEHLGRRDKLALTTTCLKHLAFQPKCWPDKFARLWSR